jgi:hypothetical protein
MDPNDTSSFVASRSDRAEMSNSCNGTYGKQWASCRACVTSVSEAPPYGWRTPFGADCCMKPNK